jgi:hypothetical protein
VALLAIRGHDNACTLLEASLQTDFALVGRLSLLMSLARYGYMLFTDKQVADLFSPLDKSFVCVARLDFIAKQNSKFATLGDE